MISVIISFLFVNLFDTAGTLLGVASRAKLLIESGEILNLDKALKADSSSSVLGSFFGVHQLLVMLRAQQELRQVEEQVYCCCCWFLFLDCYFLFPLAAIVPAYATSGALIYVAILMLSGMEKLDWSDLSELLPALIMIIMIPLTFSIANGIALGFIAYVVMKISSGEIRNISSGAWFLAVIFLAKFIFLP